jgi:hypothetical protein
MQLTPMFSAFEAMRAFAKAKRRSGSNVSYNVLLAIAAQMIVLKSI